MRVASARKQCPVRSGLTEFKCKRSRRKENCEVSVRRRMRRGCGGFAKMCFLWRMFWILAIFLSLRKGTRPRKQTLVTQLFLGFGLTSTGSPTAHSLRRGVLVLFQSRSLELLHPRHHHYLRPSTSSTSVLLSPTFSLLL